MELSDDERDEDEFEPGKEEDTDTETDKDEQERHCPLWARSSMFYLVPG